MKKLVFLSSQKSTSIVEITSYIIVYSHNKEGLCNRYMYVNYKMGITRHLHPEKRIFIIVIIIFSGEISLYRAISFAYEQVQRPTETTSQLV